VSLSLHLTDTITPRLLERHGGRSIEERRRAVGLLLTVEEFASAIVNASLEKNHETGHTIYVGSTIPS
jgi:hypothetical protein